MNFLNKAISSLAGSIKDRATDPNTMFGRMGQAFGMTDPNVATPAGLANEEQFAKTLNKFDPAVAGADAGAEQERMARNNGFRNYEEMLLWAKQRNMQSGGTISGQGRPSVQAGVNAVKSAHPAGVFNRITETLRGALGN